MMMDTWRMSRENVMLGNDSKAPAAHVLFDFKAESLVMVKVSMPLNGL
jgi:hypothetical protein